MTTKEMIEVMQAYERGEQIECRDLGTESWYPVNNDPDWSNDPDWNMSDFEYRIKPKPTYRPYKSAQEFLKAQEEHGMWLRSYEVIGCYFMPIRVFFTYVQIIRLQSDTLVSKEMEFGELLGTYRWKDGTECGVKEE